MMDSTLMPASPLVIVFICALPLSVWMLANVLSIIDQQPRSLPIIRLLLAAIGVVLLLLVTDRAWALPMASAFALVLTLHFLSGLLLRNTLGVKSYESEPKFVREAQDDKDRSYFENNASTDDYPIPAGSEPDQTVDDSPAESSTSRERPRP